MDLDEGPYQVRQVTARLMGEDDPPKRWGDLNEAERAKVLSMNYGHDTQDIDWWEYTLDDAARIGLCLGIDIDRRRKPKKDGHYIDAGPAIYFSGFSSQGDGASYAGTYKLKPDAVAAVTAEAPQDPELKRIAEELTMLGVDTAMKHGLCSFGASITRSGNDCHSGSMDVNVSFEIGGFLDYVPSELTEPLTRLLRDFADWIYNQLEAEYDHLTSDEHLTEVLSEGDYLFDSDGRII